MLHLGQVVDHNVQIFGMIVGVTLVVILSRIKCAEGCDLCGNRRPNAIPRERSAAPHSETKQMLNDTATHAREDVRKVSDAKAQALFETTAEVLKGLVKAYDDFEQKQEEAWKVASHK
jgi:hypothetical protein